MYARALDLSIHTVQSQFFLADQTGPNESYLNQKRWKSGTQIAGKKPSLHVVGLRCTVMGLNLPFLLLCF